MKRETVAGEQFQEDLYEQFSAIKLKLKNSSSIKSLKKSKQIDFQSNNLSDMVSRLSLTFATPIDYDCKLLLDDDGDDMISDLNRFSVPIDLLKSKKLSGLLKLSCNEDLLADDSLCFQDLLP